MNKLEERKELEKEFLKLYNEGLKDSQIARILEVSESKINNIRWDLNLQPNGRATVSDEEFTIKVNEGFTTSQLVEYFGMSDSAVYRRVKKLGLDLNKSMNRDKIDKERFLELYNEGHSDAKIAEILQCGSENKVARFRKSLNLNPNGRKKSINESKFMDLYNQGLNDRQIAQALNSSPSTVGVFRKGLNLPINNPIEKSVVLTNTEHQVLLGTLLGDGNISINPSGKAYGSFSHCMKQKEWALTKYEYLKNICSQPRIYDKYDERLKTPEYQQICCVIRTFKELKSDYYDKLYKDGIKYINEELLYTIEPLGLATWYMDDGSNGISGYVLCTNCFSIEDLLIIKSVFKDKFNINCNIRKDHTIYIPSNSKFTFRNLIKPYIIPSMEYKIE